MSYQVYKIMHFVGLFAGLAALSASAMYALLGGAKAENPYRKPLAMTHGLSGLLVLTGGFGMLARLGIVQGGLPTWIYVKLALWVIFAMALVLPYRSRAWAQAVLIGLPLLAALGGATALLKPF